MYMYVRLHIQYTTRHHTQTHTCMQLHGSTHPTPVPAGAIFSSCSDVGASVTTPDSIYIRTQKLLVGSTTQYTH